MFLKSTGLKYKFISLSIASVIISAILGSLILHLLVKFNQNYSFIYVLGVALFFVIIGVVGVLVTTKLMVQPVVTLTQKVHDIQNVQKIPAIGTLSMKIFHSASKKPNWLTNLNGNM